MNYRQLHLNGSLISICLLLFSPVQAETPAHSHDHMHAHETSAHTQQEYVRSEHAYSIPDVSLTSMNGSEIPLRNELNSDAPTLLNFIFTSCTAICPIMTTTFSQVQDDLAHSSGTYKMVSISIDPEQDTPARLKEYAQKHQAGSQWDFLTGERTAILEVQRAFDAYRGNKANHAPITFMRAANTEPWVRIEGFTSAKELVEEYQRLVSK